MRAGVPAVITLACYFFDKTTDDVPYPQALRELEELGADVVGLNCGRGPATILPLLKECRKVCKVSGGGGGGDDDVVGLNCGRGPATILPLLKECRKVCKVSGDDDDDGGDGRGRSSGGDADGDDYVVGLSC